MNPKLTDPVLQDAASGMDERGKEALQQQARAWARKLAVGRPDRADADALRRWCAQSAMHAQMWQRASAEWREMGKVLQAARQRIPEARSLRPAFEQRRRLLLGGAVAAAAAGVVGLINPPMGIWPSWSEMRADYRTGTGEQRSLALNAHIKLMLNTQTSLSVTHADPMQVELITGEAEIRSDGGMPVEIAAGAGLLQLGAGCVEVRHLEPAMTTVWCTEGQAQLHHAGQVVTLQAGESVSYGKLDAQAPVPRRETNAPGWRQGFVVFHDTPLKDAVIEINRYRSGRVILLSETLASRRISGRFTIKDVDQALALIQQLYDARLRRVGEVVLLS